MKTALFIRSTIHAIMLDMSGSLNKTQRDSNFELLRIFAMTSIVLCHFIMAASRYLETISDTNFYYFCMFFKGWTGAFGNILFMLISGYFLCTSDFKWQKVLKF